MAERVQVLLDDSRKLFDRFGVTHVVIEWPKFFASSKGRTTADKGDLGKLYLAASALFCQAITHGAKADLLDVNAWKGQLNKAAVIYHIRRRMAHLGVDDNTFHSHEWDAVGIGLSVLGSFI